VGKVNQKFWSVKLQLQSRSQSKSNEKFTQFGKLRVMARSGRL
jgi:hypothetical protein